MSARSCENCVYEYVCDWHEANEEYSCGDWLPDLSMARLDARQTGGKAND